MKTVSALALAALLIVSPGQAFAKPQPASVKVTYADLNLDRADGRTALERRVERAIRHVCPRASVTTDLRGQHVRRACMEVARGKADEQLTALFEGRLLADNAVTVRAGS